MLESGADGIAFGCLDENGEIQVEQTRELCGIIKGCGGEAVFHRAFDCVADPQRAIEQLIELGIDRVLTSGGKEKATEGAALLASLQRDYGARIEILAGSGVNAGNAAALMEQTGVRQVHSSCRGWVNDPTTKGESVAYAYAASPNEKAYEAALPGLRFCWKRSHRHFGAFLFRFLLVCWY